MSASHSDQATEAGRLRRIQQVVGQVCAQRQPVDITEICGQHPELMPELAAELAKLQRIEAAIEQAEDQQVERALQRLQGDWARDAGMHQQQSGSQQSGSAVQSGRSLASTDGGFAAQSTARGQTRIGRYLIEGLLGQGGFGRVYRAWDEQLARHVAIKVPHSQRLSEPVEVEAYLDEARILAGLDHPAIVPVFDAGRSEDGRCFLVSKLIRGADLATRMQETRVCQDDAARLVRRISEALHYAHRSGIVHRDIKPANILLDAQHNPYLTDFGLARPDAQRADRMSRAGTPAYMSPEQVRGEAHRIDGRSDIFSLGVVLYELLTGCKPFAAAGYDELLEQVLWIDPAPPGELDRAVSPELERICLKSLAKRASDRYWTAQELADDLRHFLEHRAPQTGRPTLSPYLDAARGDEGQAAAASMIPKGLRAFAAEDAESFLDLLPGPWDRNGLPESIRQWKHRIESMDSSTTFDLGLLYGPSGCGKSSLVCAGLIPRLATHVSTIYLAATPEETEQRLQRQLRRSYPELTAESSLAGELARLRQGGALPVGQKLLLVIDQFEQWLHGRDEARRRSLVEALRQCDGGRVQCLLLVRDDFWLAVSRFMSEVEVDLVQGHNTALVDLFDTHHARQVLARFGRCYARLPQDPAELSPAQSTFLDRAVAGLSEDNKVVPVRLALFVEMVKDRPWTPATLREIGGADGVGVTYLEETFSGRKANPQHRMHQRAARSVLEALLPEPGSDIKGHICSYPELVDLSGYGNRPDDFRQLVRILDSETRLLTPTEIEIDEPATGDMSHRVRYYQLTHDYLVPALRDWLTRKQRATTAGRTELRLAERASMWCAKPERRQLPSLSEWVAMRCLTRAALWTSTQRKMMRAAARKHAVSWGALCLLILIFLFSGTELAAVAKSTVLRFRARTAMVWLALGRDKAIWPLLKHEPDPSMRTALMHRISPLVVDPKQLVEELAGYRDVSVRRAMLLLVGELAGDPDRRKRTSISLRDTDPRQAHIRELIELYRDDPDPGTHSAAEWSLQRYEREVEIDRVRHRLVAQGLTGDRQWIETPQGHTLVIIPGLIQFMMGSPASERNRSENEALHPRRIRANFAIASKETTVEQFERFLREHPEMRAAAHFRAGASRQLPQAGVTWYQAAAYCNWLSKSEGLPPSQCCYAPNAEGEYGAGMKIKEDHSLLGYRLPTEAEWEYACRAHAQSSRYFGSGDRFLGEYAVYDWDETMEMPWPVGRRKPNDFGLFDMLGNVSEWCQDTYHANAALMPNDDFAGPVSDAQPRVLRGGSFRDPADQLRSAARASSAPGLSEGVIGFRVARNYLP